MSSKLKVTVMKSKWDGKSAEMDMDSHKLRAGWERGGPSRASVTSPNMSAQHIGQHSPALRTKPQCRQPACCFQEPPWIAELRQSSHRTSKGKPEDIFSTKYDPVWLIVVLSDVLRALLSFVFQSSESQWKLHSVAVMVLTWNWVACL